MYCWHFFMSILRIPMPLSEKKLSEQDRLIQVCMRQGISFPCKINRADSFKYFRP